MAGSFIYLSSHQKSADLVVKTETEPELYLPSHSPNRSHSSETQRILEG